jgi:hypothetical protein
MIRSAIVAASITTLTAIPAGFAYANFVGPGHAQAAMTDGNTPWNDVVKDYNARGYDWTNYRNTAGNVWHVWTSQASGNTLIWSKDVNHGQGLGYNCHASALPNLWSSCKRYDLTSGEQTGFVGVAIHDNGVVEDND